MKKKQEVAQTPGVVTAVEEEKVFEMPGFFRVASPVRSPAFHCEGRNIFNLSGKESANLRPGQPGGKHTYLESPLANSAIRSVLSYDSLTPERVILQ